MLFGSDQDAAPPTPFFVDAILHGYERASLTTVPPRIGQPSIPHAYTLHHLTTFALEPLRTRYITHHNHTRTAQEGVWMAEPVASPDHTKWAKHKLELARERVSFK